MNTNSCPANYTLYGELRTESKGLIEAMEAASSDHIKERTSVTSVHARLLTSGDLTSEQVAQQLEQLKREFDQNVKVLLDEFHSQADRICGFHSADLQK